ncbi:MAG: hypothetical protein IPP66_14780 [Anaerolineales bacterium]|nr:hypothetical protein [Anaerolineales bacterium]
MFEDTPAISPEPIVQGDLPDWVKAMAPQQQTQPAGQEEEIPDWINKIGTGALLVPSASSTSGDGDDWMNLLGEAPAAQQKDSNPELDWLKGLGDEQPASISDNQQDWMKDFGAEEQPAPAIQSDDQPDWLKSFGTEQGSSDFDFLNELKSEPEEPMTPQPKPETPKPASQPSTNAEDLGKSGQEIDDALAWFEGLAAKQGATEGLLTKPEERMDQEPDWVKKVKGAGNAAAQQTPAQQPVQQPPVVETPKPATPVTPAPQPVANVEDLGKSGQEIDDALAWFESLAAKQGATEGLLTKPEERLEQEPEWVKQAKSAPQQPPVQQPVAETPTPEPAPQPVANVEDLGKSGQEIDDALAWFESLAAKQGATEGLLTKPEERLEQEPEWVKQAKNAPQQPVVETPAPAPEPVANVEDLGKSGQEIDDALAWFESLAAKQGATEGLLTKPEERLEQEPEWVKQAKSAPQQPVVAQPEEELAPVDDVSSWLKGLDTEEETQQPAPVMEDDTASWLKSLDEPEESPIPSTSVSDDLPAWMKGISEEEPPVAEPVIPMDEAKPVQETQDVTSWLSSLAEEDIQSPAIPVSDDLPAWMRDDTGEVVAEPTKIEPTRPADWKPVDEREEAVLPPPPAPKVVSQPKPEPTPMPVQEKPAPEPKKRPATSRKTEIKPATPPEPYKEPVTRRMTGMLTMPVDPILGSARNELSRSNIPGALETYEKLIKKGRFLEEVIYDLREALYRYPVEVSIWQTLGDAYMRANQLQDALDAYTKAEELLR